MATAVTDTALSIYRAKRSISISTGAISGRCNSLSRLGRMLHANHPYRAALERYIFNLRELGVQIETLHERHDGPYSGTHARYILRSVVTQADGGAA